MCAGKDAEHSVDNVGTVPAALTTYLACQQYKPDLLISVGTAGGFKAQGAAIGDVFVGTTTVNHDRRIPIPVLHTQYKSMLPFKLGRAAFGAFPAAFLNLACCLSELGMLPFRARHAAFGAFPAAFLSLACCLLRLACCLSYLGPSYRDLLLLLTDHYRLAVPACSLFKSQAMSVCISCKIFVLYFAWL